MDKKVFLTVTLCAAIFLVWQNYYIKPFTEKQQAWIQSQNKTVETTNPTLNKPVASISANPTTEKAAKDIELSADNFSVVISTKGAVVNNTKIKNYKGTSPDHTNLLVGGQNQLELSTPAGDFSYLSKVIYSSEPIKNDKFGNSAVKLFYSDENVSIERVYTLYASNYTLGHDININFKKQAPNYVFIGLNALKQIPKEKSENERRNIFFGYQGGQKNWAVSDIDALKEDLSSGNWISFSSRYFVNALVDLSLNLKPQFQVQPTQDGQVLANLIYKVEGTKLQIPQKMYFGPKEIENLKAVGKHLDTVVDFGWFTFFAYPLLKTLKWLYQYVHNYGIAIILLTILVKLLTYPLTAKSMKSMKEMQKIQPQMNRLREKYKDDKEKLNQEMLQLMKTHGYNPMSGCLPMFIQMPIFIALYNVLYGAIDLYGQPFFGWIHDLSSKDPFYVTPVLLGLMMFFQQKMTPNTSSDPAQQKMMTMMPLIFSVMMLWLPSGLTLYMLVNSVVSVIQQIIINKGLNVSSNKPIVV